MFFDDLVISGKRLYNMGEYDLSNYENFIVENLQLIGELVKNVQ